MTRHQKLSSCLIEPRPASYKTDPPMSKDEPISDGGNTFVIMHLRSENNYYGATARRVRVWERNLKTPR